MYNKTCLGIQQEQPEVSSTQIAWREKRGSIWEAGSRRHVGGGAARGWSPVAPGCGAPPAPRALRVRGEGDGSITACLCHQLSQPPGE